MDASKRDEGGGFSLAEGRTNIYIYIYKIAVVERLATSGKSNNCNIIVLYLVCQHVDKKTARGTIIKNYFVDERGTKYTYTCTRTHAYTHVSILFCLYLSVVLSFSFSSHVSRCKVSKIVV